MYTLLASGARASGRRERTTLSDTHCVYSATVSPTNMVLELETRPSATTFTCTMACRADAALARSGKEVEESKEIGTVGRRRRWYGLAASCDTLATHSNTLATH